MRTLKRHLFVWLAAAMLLAAAFGGFVIPRTVSAAPATDGTTYEYPFRTGADAFAYGASWTNAQQASASAWAAIFVNYDTATVDLSSAEYVAVQVKNVSGDPGWTIGWESGAGRYSIGSGQEDGNPIYFMNESGAVTQLSVQNGAVNFGSEAGALIIPVDSLGWQWNPNSDDFTTVKNFLFTTNIMHNYDWTLQVGEIGYYDGEIGAQGTTFTKITTVQSVSDYSKFFSDSANTTLTRVLASDEQGADGALDTDLTYDYPFAATGLNAYQNGADWVGPTVQDPLPPDPANWHTLTVNFDTATVDLSDAAYIAVQMKNVMGDPGWTFGLNGGDTRYSNNWVVPASEDVEFYFMTEDGALTLLSPDPNTWNATRIGSGVGTLLIPVDMLQKQYGTQDDHSTFLAAAESFTFCTNSQYNINWRLQVAGIGYYDGDPSDEGTHFTQIATPSADSFASLYSKNDDDESNGSTLSMVEEISEGDVVPTTWGDVTVDLEFTGREASAFTVWDGGATGTAEMVKDSYGYDAVQLTSTGANPNGGDAYTATTLADGVSYDWTGAAGVTLWARNDGTSEVSFNLEFDYKKQAGGDAGRFNVFQGNRYYLYDVNTGLTYIYMTKPTINLPVGFEGWVRIPFSAFRQADWSVTDVGVVEFTPSVDGIITYLCTTVYSTNYTNMPFSINMLGTYDTTPSFVSSYVTSANSIPALMGLAGE